MSAGITVLVLPLALAAGRAAGRAADAATERQRRRIEARSRLDRASTDHQALARRVEAARGQHGDAVSPLPPLPADALASPRDHEVDAVLATIAAAVGAGEQRLRDELARARTARLVASLASLASPDATASPNAPATPAPAPTAPTGRPSYPTSPAGPNQPGRPAAGPPAELAETVSRVFGRLDTSVAPAVLARLDDRARQVLSAPAGHAIRLLDDLRFAVQAANDERAARRARLADLHDRIGRFDGEEVALARQRLFDADDDLDPDWDALEAEVNRAIDRAVETALRAYTAAALRESLEEVGCEVEEGFDVLLVHDGFAHLRRPGWDDLAIRVRAGDADGVLRFNAVTPRDAAAELAEPTEQDWCATFDSLVPRLAGKGVALEVTDRSDVGDPHVQRIAPRRYPFPRAAVGSARAEARSETQAAQRLAVGAEAETEVEVGTGAELDAATTTALDADADADTTDRRRTNRDRADARERRRQLPPPR